MQQQSSGEDSDRGMNDTAPTTQDLFGDEVSSDEETQEKVTAVKIVLLKTVQFKGLLFLRFSN